jgi:hypothetical protein
MDGRNLLLLLMGDEPPTRLRGTLSRAWQRVVAVAPFVARALPIGSSVRLCA